MPMYKWHLHPILVKFTSHRTLVARAHFEPHRRHRFVVGEAHVAHLATSPANLREHVLNSWLPLHVQTYERQTITAYLPRSWKKMYCWLACRLGNSGGGSRNLRYRALTTAAPCDPSGTLAFHQFF
jgi:hypothetical protein